MDKWINNKLRELRISTMDSVSDQVFPECSIEEAFNEIIEERDKEWKAKIQKILDQGHGGGSWRRLLNQLLK